MRFMGSNPVVKRAQQEGYAAGTAGAATYGGIIRKLSILFALLAGSGVMSAAYVFDYGFTPGVTIGMVVAIIVALISVIVATVSTRLAPVFSIVYVLSKGFALGAISSVYAISLGNHIVSTALMSTGGVFLAMFFLYKSGIITVGPIFRRVMFTALVGLVFASLFMMGFFMFAGAGLGNIGLEIYAVIVVVAVVLSSLFLLIDFDNIQKAVEGGADAKYEWMLSLGLVVTVVWLYLELLRLIALLNARR